MNRINAGALYYAVFIAFISSVIVVFFLLSSYLHSKLVTIELQKDKVTKDVSSAMVLLQSDPTVCDYNRQTRINLFGEEDVPVIVFKKRHGVYDVLYAEAS